MLPLFANLATLDIYKLSDWKKPAEAVFPWTILFGTLNGMREKPAMKNDTDGIVRVT